MSCLEMFARGKPLLFEKNMAALRRFVKLHLNKPLEHFNLEIQDQGSNIWTLHTNEKQTANHTT